MLIIPSGVKIHLALGRTDMRKGFDSLAVLVQETLKKDPFSGHLFAFRGRKADTMKILFWDGNGLCLFSKRLQQGRFIWPSLCEPGGTVTLTPAQLAMLNKCRNPHQIWGSCWIESACSSMIRHATRSS
jgi:transposase